jgi:hypothetical protein
MSVPFSEVGYSSATTGRGYREVHKGYIGKKTARSSGYGEVVSYGEVLGDKRTMCIRVTVLFITFMQYSSGFILYHCTYGCVFCVLLFNFVIYRCLFSFSWRDTPPPPPIGPCHLHSRCFYITQRRATVGRTPLDEWSACRRDLYLTTHNTHDKHPCTRWNSKPQSQQTSGRRPTTLTAQPLGPAIYRCHIN